MLGWVSHVFKTCQEVKEAGSGNWINLGALCPKEGKDAAEPPVQLAANLELMLIPSFAG